jgi:cytoskeleton protein RodZ
MESLSARLIREREQRQITLEEISASTKIRMHFLVAMEEERFDKLPGGIITKGFLRSYARCVGIDDDSVVADYLATLRGNEIVPTLPPIAEKESVAAAMELPWWVFVSAFFFIAVGLFTVGQVKRALHAPPTLSSAKPLAPQVGDAAPRLGAQPVGINADVVARPPAPDQASTSRAEFASFRGEGDSATATLPSANAAVEPEPFFVLIRAREDAWVSIIADGKPIMQDTLLASTQRSVEAHRYITIRAGNVGGLDFSFNGEVLPAQGDYDVPRTLHFDAQGLEGIVPKLSSVATPVQQ